MNRTLAHDAFILLVLGWAMVLLMLIVYDAVSGMVLIGSLVLLVFAIGLVCHDMLTGNHDE